MKQKSLETAESVFAVINNRPPSYSWKWSIVIQGLAFILLTISVLFVEIGCGRKDDREALIAKVGSEQINRRELLALYGLDSQSDTSADRDSSWFRDAAEKWAWEQILVQEAERRHLDQDRSFLQRMDELRHQLLIKMLYDQEDTSIKVSDIEIRQEYNKHPEEYITPHDQIDLTYILAPSREQARKARSAFQNGTQLEKILNSNPGLKGEALGWVEEGDLSPTIAPAAFVLVPGGVSVPLKFGDSQYIVLYCRQRRTAGTRRPLQEVSDQIRDKLILNKRLEAEKNLRDHLWLTYNPQIFIKSEDPDTSKTERTP